MLHKRVKDAEINSKKAARAGWLALLLLLVWGGVLRGYDLTDQGFWIDEGASVTIARGILDNGRPELANHSVHWEGAPFHYLMAPVLAMMDDMHVGGRLLSVVLGVLSIGLMAGVSWQVSGSAVQGMLAALLMTVATWEIAWSRQARFYLFLQVVMMGGVGCMWCMTQRRSLWVMVGALVCLLLAAATHRAGYLLFMFAGMGVLLQAPQLIRGLCGIKGRVRIGLMLGLLVLLAGCLVLLLRIPSGQQAVMNALTSSGLSYVRQYSDFLREQLGWLIWLIPVGILAAGIGRWRAALFLGVPLAAYLFVISVQTELFAFRYVFPVFFVLLWFIAYGVFAVVRLLVDRMPFLWMKSAIWLGVMGLLLAVPWQRTLLPQSRYILGRTAPQPEWKEAYTLLKERELKLQALGRGRTSVAVVSALPMLDQLYFGDHIGTQYYLPVSYSGMANDQQHHSPFTVSTPVQTVEQLQQLSGYLILDDFGLFMLLNKDMQNYLTHRKPNALIHGQYNIFIWVLEPQMQ